MSSYFGTSVSFQRASDALIRAEQIRTARPRGDKSRSLGWECFLLLNVFTQTQRGENVLIGVQRLALILADASS
ncbi:hypothetical protein R1flu_017734 [Riccia fluitans]|uniref:Uncharacterized protein n=1 Tax=Riccia fluitans TaxID=41844 RepID=A0ABD1ZDT7_9MARC